MDVIRRGVVATLVFAAVTGCSVFGGADEDGDPGERTVVLVTHDSFTMKPEVLDEFRNSSGIRIEVRKTGDAGALTNQLVLTKGSPLGDVAFGVDNTFASRALKEGVFVEYRSPDADKGSRRYAVDGTDRLTAIDVGDVCLNADPAAFAGKGIEEPTRFEDLTDPKYKDALVVQDPATSSPGLAFLLGTIAHFGEQGWQGYWSGLKANGVKVVSGWEEAYTQDFSGSSGKGPRPVVVSYASSPAAELGPDGRPRTRALLFTCFRQVEYAGVLAGAANPEDAKKVVDFLLSQQFQSNVPEQMFVYPVREDVPLPAAWQGVVLQPSNPETLPAADIDANRERWINQWRALVLG
ncbi:MAG TPA: thiamine ABC transporter substrate-binding protein [Actinophytocola sp.]|uniref:thiamine ABC transporter substrate-binding protein n=1 Tax=Actinophytocola sp. TaxID=1872138 RepID=UPI002DB90C7F|nr:thiamine ABC transporter substrate-binding protein [Actinophytocola sp.]HEU5472081.1 thiamine ABC transporter substrate-binding protein [Actinophytocola sp.]